MAAINRPGMLLGTRSFGRVETILHVLVIVYVPITAGLLVAWLLDGTQLLGENIWIKPFKFSVSIGLNGAAFIWLLRRVTPNKWLRGAAMASAVALATEQILISVQAARGVRSHFNMTEGIDSTIYAMMGNFVGVVWVATLILALNVSRRRFTDPVLKAITVLGTWLVLMGASVGFALVAAGKHTIGGEDGGAILPVVGWNRTLGDLRPAHFVGLHAMQVLIAVAWIARRLKLSERRTVAAVIAAAAALAVLCIGTLAQAYTGRSVASESSLLVGVAVVVATTITWRRTDAALCAKTLGSSPLVAEDQ